MTRVAFFDDRYFEVYGAQENVLLLAEMAGDAGHDVVFVTTADGALAEAAQSRGVSVVIVDAPERLKVFEKGAVRGGIIRMLRSSIDALRYSALLDRKLRAIGVEVVVAAAVRPALLLAKSRLPFGPKVLLYAQNSTPFGAFAAAAIPGIDMIAPIATGAMTTFPGWALRIFRPSVHVMASGRDLDHFAVDRGEDHEGDIRLLSIGSLTERKGFHDLIDAVALVAAGGTHIDLTIVGGTSGPESERYLADLKRRVKQSELPVVFTGWTNDVRPQLAAANVFALASSNEGLPGVIIEAMASGLPVVATDAGGTRDAVTAGCGHIVPVGDVESLASRIGEFEDSELRASLGDNARRRAHDEFSQEAFYKRFDVLLQGVLTK